jgi:hypothetical protein
MMNCNVGSHYEPLDVCDNVVLLITQLFRWTLPELNLKLHDIGEAEFVSYQTGGLIVGRKIILTVTRGGNSRSVPVSAL